MMTDFPDTEMEMRKLHMGTVSYGFESMDEVAHQLHVAFGSGDKGKVLASLAGSFSSEPPQRIKNRLR